jgi:dipeptidyl aminopeptidase/acylaminoacyl peptidase
MFGVMGGEKNFIKYSPYYVIKNDINFNFQNNIYLLHGSNDITVPIDSSIKFNKMLKKKNFNSNFIEFLKYNHTDIIFCLNNFYNKEKNDFILKNILKLIN